jgi:hypothetical protein
MEEYPSIQNSSKAPRKPCIAFDKLDGSNFRAKWTAKRKFDLFGTRTQLINENTPGWNEMIAIFRQEHEKALDKFFSREFPNVREVSVYGEYFGENSFAGLHKAEPHKIVIFDVLVGHKQRKFMRPQDFVKQIGSIVEIPRVVYQGNLNDAFIADVRRNAFDTKEGVICKGTEPVGNAAGGIWMAKVKTQAYLDSLKERFGADWVKYGE